MLGSLARWLRILGFDTAYDNRIEDDEVVRVCLEQDRFLLTRDRRLVKRRLLRTRSLLVAGDDLPGQIRQVLGEMQVTPTAGRLLTRCPVCNSRLIDTAPEEIEDSVPPYVYKTQKLFKECPSCARVFWGGTHRERIRERLKRWRIEIRVAGKL